MVSSLFQNYICGFNNRNYRLMLPWKQRAVVRRRF
jgi:hypothetical protein